MGSRFPTSPAIATGRPERQFYRIAAFSCLVGGLPERPRPPWNYQAPYSPSDVIEIYTRPGIIAPELSGAEADCYDSIRQDLEDRGIVFKVSTEELRACAST